MGLKWNRLCLVLLFLFSTLQSLGQLDESLLNDLREDNKFEEARPHKKKKSQDKIEQPSSISQLHKNSNTSEVSSGMQIVGICLLVIVIGLMLYYIIVQRNRTPIDKKIEVEKKLVENIEEIEDITTLETVDLLKISEDNESYNVSVRILFLQLLQLLNDRNLILWKKRKTNREYLSELIGHHAHIQFVQLTQIYEQAWYGDTTVTQEEYASIKISFVSIIQSLTNEK